jgi:hypothetical protein
VAERAPCFLVDVLVFEAGYVAMALSLAWAGSLVWQRRTRPTGLFPADRTVASAARVRGSAGWGP